jgi:hypothetical protein
LQRPPQNGLGFVTGIEVAEITIRTIVRDITAVGRRIKDLGKCGIVDFDKSLITVSIRTRLGIAFVS